MNMPVNIADAISQKRFNGLKICMVSPYLPKTGGIAVQTHLMVSGLESEGAVVNRVDTILHKLDKRCFFPLRILLQPIVTAVKFLRCARRSDVVHIHGCSWWGFVPVMVCASLNRLFFKKRLVISFHGGAGDVWLKQYSRIALPFFRMADRVVVVSPRLQSVFSEYRVSATVLWNLVNLDRFPFYERNTVAPRIAWIRSFEKAYDPLTALKVFKVVKEQLPRATITFIGDGSLRKSMEEYISEHDLDGVHFTGKLPNDAVSAEFQNADVLLNTSMRDGLPTALLEASASGLPIVSTDVGGIPSLIESGKNGILVSVGDVEAMAHAIIALAGDPHRASAISIAARTNAERFGWDRCALELLKLYGIAEEER